LTISPYPDGMKNFAGRKWLDNIHHSK
jgi:hypothetical protein